MVQFIHRVAHTVLAASKRSLSFCNVAPRVVQRTIVVPRMVFSFRKYSAAASTSAEEIQERMLTTIKDFDKINVSKVIL